MKGKTIIELKDVNTGEVERHVDNNMMTNALKYFYKTTGFMLTDNVPKDELVKWLLGGIMLFDTKLEENADNIYPPAEVRMIGNGAIGVVSTDDVSEMGIYNETESGWQDDGSFVQVYDFGTSQANGTIESVCLTSNFCGYIGYGNTTSGARKKTLQNVFAYRGNHTSYGISNKYGVWLVNYEESIVDMLNYSNFSLSGDDSFLNTKKIIIERYKIPLTKLALNGTSSKLIKVSETEITVPDEFIEYCKSLVGVTLVRLQDSDCNNYIFLRGSYYWSASSPLKILKIGVDNSLSIINLINTTGTNVNMSKFYPMFEKNYMVVDDPGNISKLWAISLSDSSVTEFDNIDGKWTNTPPMLLCKNGLIFLEGKCINVVRKESYYHNGTASIGPYNLIGNPVLNRYWESEGTVTLIKQMMYIASINNLDSPVSKTASKTMKVIYRLTF